MRKPHAPHLEIIREAIATFDDYRPANEKVLLRDTVIQDAVLMRLQLVGEHLARMRHIDDERFAQLADASWYQLIGLRNVISHGYETIDQRRIWQMIGSELPALSTKLDAVPER